MMSSLSEKDRKTLRLGGIAAGVIVFLMVGLFPAMDYWESQNKKLAEAQKKLRDIESQVSNAASAALMQKTLQQKVRIHTDPSSLNRQPAMLLEQVQRLPSYRLLAVQRQEGMPLRNDESLTRSAVSLQFSGTLPAVHRLLQEIESASPALKVDRLTVATERRNPQRIEGQMVISGYAVVARTKGKNG